jgi:hypothetical protein
MSELCRICEKTTIVKDRRHLFGPKSSLENDEVANFIRAKETDKQLYM